MGGNDAHAAREGLAGGYEGGAVGEVGPLALHYLYGRLVAANNDGGGEALAEGENGTVLLRPFFEFAVFTGGEDVSKEIMQMGNSNTHWSGMV